MKKKRKPGVTRERLSQDEKIADHLNLEVAAAKSEGSAPDPEISKLDLRVRKRPEFKWNPCKRCYLLSIGKLYKCDSDSEEFIPMKCICPGGFDKEAWHRDYLDRRDIKAERADFSD